MPVLRRALVCLCLSLISVSISTSLTAQERLVRLHAPDALIDSGLLKHILPRFSLKTQVGVRLVPEVEAELVLGAEGRAVMEGVGRTWHIARRAETPEATRLHDWLISEIGQRTIFAFAPEGAPLFVAPKVPEVAVAVPDLDGDAARGAQVSQTACGRCHAVNAAGRKTDIGSTPSFFVLRAMGDWEDRFGAFYVLKPHAAFTQVTDVTPPFPEDRPSPIVPVEITLDDLDNIIAYVGALQPADLGAPIQHQ